MHLTVADTTPYAWPYDGLVEPRRTALVVVTPHTGPALVATPVGDRVGAIGELLQSRGGTVIHAMTVPPPHRGGEDITPWLGADLVVWAGGVDGFYGSRLDSVLRRRGVDRLLLTGVGLETCIHSTMRSANDRGYECLLVLDACLAYDPALVGPARSQVEMSGGIFGAVGDTANLLTALSARDEERTSP